MNTFETLQSLFLPRMLCTGITLVTGSMLAFAWFGPATPYDPVSVAIAFAGGLVGRCLLVRSATVNGRPTAAANEPRSMQPRDARPSPAGRG